MNNEKYNQIISDAYKNYCEQQSRRFIQGCTYQEFVEKIKTDDEFAKTWGLKIEERELSEKERIVLSGYEYENRGGIGWNILKETVDMDNSIPRKLITITYNNTKTEIYE